jgi:hypothetical protein
MRLGSGAGEPDGNSPGLTKIANVSHDLEGFSFIGREDGRGRFSSDGAEHWLRGLSFGFE